MIQERRLLVVTESMGVGGTESHLLRLLPRLSASGWKSAVFCVSGRGERADELESRGVEVSCAQRAETQSIIGRRPTRILHAAGGLFWFIRRWHPQIAHFYLPGPYLIGAPIAIAQQVPLKIMSRRSLSVYQQNWPMVAGIERALHRQMDALIGPSGAVVSQLLEEGAPEAKVRLIYNGIEAKEPLATRAASRRELGIDENALVGIVVANLIHYKGHQDLIKGLGQVGPQLPPNWLVLLVGRDEGLGTKLKLLAGNEGIAGHIRFLGQRSDVPCLLSAADFGLLTSHEEGFSNFILESMAAELPMIVTAVGGNPEAVVNEETGLVIPTHNPGAIGSAVLRLACKPELRMRLGAAGRDRVIRKFSLDRCAAAHAELYEELLGNVEHFPPQARVDSQYVQ